METNPASINSPKKKISIWQALFPVLILVCMLAYNVSIYGDDALSGSNQFILLLGGAIAAIVGFRNKVSIKKLLEQLLIICNQLPEQYLYCCLLELYRVPGL